MFLHHTHPQSSNRCHTWNTPPIEVSPGVLSTDATAKVFGFVPRDGGESPLGQKNGSNPDRARSFDLRGMCSGKRSISPVSRQQFHPRSISPSSRSSGVTNRVEDLHRRHAGPPSKAPDVYPVIRDLITQPPDPDPISIERRFGSLNQLPKISLVPPAEASTPFEVRRASAEKHHRSVTGEGVSLGMTPVQAVRLRDISTSTTVYRPFLRAVKPPGPMEPDQTMLGREPDHARIRRDSTSRHRYFADSPAQHADLKQEQAMEPSLKPTASRATTLSTRELALLAGRKAWVSSLCGSSKVRPVKPEDRLVPQTPSTELIRGTSTTSQSRETRKTDSEKTTMMVPRQRREGSLTIPKTRGFGKNHRSCRPIMSTVTMRSTERSLSDDWLSFENGVGHGAVEEHSSELVQALIRMVVTGLRNGLNHVFVCFVQPLLIASSPHLSSRRGTKPALWKYPVACLCLVLLLWGGWVLYAALKGVERVLGALMLPLRVLFHVIGFREDASGALSPPS